MGTEFLPAQPGCEPVRFFIFLTILAETEQSWKFKKIVQDDRFIDLKLGNRRVWTTKPQLNIDFKNCENSMMTKMDLVGVLIIIVDRVINMTPASKDVPCFLKLKTPVARGRRAGKEGLGGNLPLFMGIVNSSTRKISLEMDTRSIVLQAKRSPHLK